MMNSIPPWPEKLVLMREGGRRLSRILTTLLAQAQPAVTLRSLDAVAEELITEAGGTPSFKTVKGYRWASCLCVNEVVVHGIPTEYALREGDILTIDVGLLYQGLHTDTAWTKLIQNFNPPAGGQNYEDKAKFLKTGEEALGKAIAVARVGNRVGHISQAIGETIEGAGYGIVRTLVGHGVGRQLHEPPQIPGFLKGPLEETPMLVAGMTLAIEVIYARGSGVTEYLNDDGWTIATQDRSLAAVFEHTVAVTASGPEVLTRVAE